jgi:hypothetical protein
MNYSKGRRHAHVGGDRKSHVALRCCLKMKVLLSTCTKTSKRKENWSTMNLTTIIETTKAKHPK